MKDRLINDLFTVLTVPSEPILAFGRTRLFKDDPNGIGKANGIMGYVRWEQKHLAFADGNIMKSAIFLDDFEEHRTAKLEKPLCGFVDMVVRSSVGTAYDLL